jgi:predicted ArsR family transcriptional regulator
MRTETLRARILQALEQGEQSFSGLCQMQLNAKTTAERLRVGEALSDLVAEGLVETRTVTYPNVKRPSSLYRLVAVEREDDGV